MKNVETLMDVVERRLCVACGACAYICPEHVRLFDFETEGIRPVTLGQGNQDWGECLKVCPALQSDLVNARCDADSQLQYSGSGDAPSRKEWGPVLEIWEGHATNPEIRYHGSSGGALTAIGAYCLERPGMHGVLHIAQNPDDPLRNQTRLSRTREELLAATGSRYAPASVCDSLKEVEDAPAPCVVIGKPSEIAGLRNAQKLRPALDEKVGIALSFFCAESPSTKGTTALLKKMGYAPQAVRELKYRGRGWPGHFVPLLTGETEPRRKMTYRESWAFLQAYRPWSVHVWPDGTGELADISCGDPWYEEPDGQNPGFSLVVVRTERGREILREAMEAGYLQLQPAEAWKLEKSQEGLIRKKGAVWGRLLAMRLFGLPAPNLRAQGLFHCWLKLPLKEKLKSTVGTVRRIWSRKLYKPLKLDMATAVPVRRAFVSKAES